MERVKQCNYKYICNQCRQYIFQHLISLRVWITWVITFGKNYMSTAPLEIYVCRVEPVSFFKNQWHKVLFATRRLGEAMKFWCLSLFSL